MHTSSPKVINFQDGPDTLTCDQPLGTYRIIANNYQGLLSTIGHTPKLKKYEWTCSLFAKYLEGTQTKFLSLSGINLKNLDRVYEKIRYNHRWKEEYRKFLLAKFYQLEDYVRENPTALSMISLTTYQDGFYSNQVTGRDIDIYDSFELLKNSRHKLIQMITTKRGIRPGVDYFWVIEPHKTGYPHCHLILLTDLSQPEINRIQDLWVKYQAGSREHGVKVTISRKEDSIKSIKNYLMKYLSKTFIDGDTGSRYSSGSWSPGEFVFNAIVREKGYRTWCCSRGLAKVMDIKCEPSRPIVWEQMKLEDDDDTEFMLDIKHSGISQLTNQVILSTVFTLYQKVHFPWSSIITKRPVGLSPWVHAPYLAKWFDQVIEL